MRLTDVSGELACHLLELRVIAEDHQTELEPFDRFQFVVK
jgi:hypothetical protein